MPTPKVEVQTYSFGHFFSRKLHEIEKKLVREEVRPQRPPQIHPEYSSENTLKATRSENTFQSFNIEVYEKVFFSVEFLVLGA